jgi:hypothetical protein
MEKAWYHDRELRSDEEGYTTDLITKYALEFIDKNKEGPFFCYIPHEAVHNPLHAKYEDILRVPEAVRKGTKLLTEAEYAKYFEDYNGWQKMPVEQRKIVYSAMLISLDDNIGKVIEKLENENILDNTIIVFVSDNGATPTGNNLPLRGTKHTVFQGGIQVPAAVWWKGGPLEGGEIFTGDFGYLDVYPTLAGMAGVERLEGKALDGRDLSKSIRTLTPEPVQELHWMWEYEGAVRKDNWKLIYHPRDMQLYDLSTDLAETNNLIDDEPKIASRLQKAHESWLRRLGANPSYLRPIIPEVKEASPQGQVLEIYAEQIKGVNNPKAGLTVVISLGAGKDFSDYTTPGDVIEYDICVADDSRLDGFYLTPSRAWAPKFSGYTGYDQFDRLQTLGPAPKGGRGVWEHRVVGIGNICPLRLAFCMVCLTGESPGTYRFYLDNVVLRKPDGRIIDLWKDDSRNYKGPNQFIPADHSAFKNVSLKAIELDTIKTGH